GPPLPGNPHPVGGHTSPVAEAVTAVDDLVFGSTEDYMVSGEPGAAFSTPSAVALPAVRATKDTPADGDPLDALAPVADLILGTEENESETTYAPVEYVPPADPPGLCRLIRGGAFTPALEVQ